MSFEDIEDENEGMTLVLNEKGELEDFKEEDYVSVPRKDMDLVQSFIEANQEAFRKFCKERTDSK
jgi:hypothetical protein